MRWFIIIALTILLIATETWAGTFRDNFFDGNLKGWALDNNWEKVEFQVEKGEACIQTHAWKHERLGGHCQGTMAIGSSDWRDYTLELKVKTVESDHGGGHAIVIGIRTEKIPSESFSPRDYAGVYMRIVADPNGIFGSVKVYKIIKIDPPVEKKVMINVGENQLPIIWKKTHEMETVFDDGGRWAIAFDKWYRVKAVAKDKHFKLYFNDELVAAFNERNITSGKVRLSAVRGHVHFDDVVITGKEIPNIGPSGMAVSPKGRLATTWGNVKRY